jgi:glycosyltransferase involved in cell wall biosynthesis
MSIENKKVLFFFPHNPYPAKSGAHKRCLEMLAGLKELGCEVTLMSSTLSSETPWELSSIEVLKSQWCNDVLIYEPTRLDYKLICLFARYYRFTKQTPPISSLLNAPLGMRSWFLKKFELIKPEIIVMNYVYWDQLFHNKKINSVRKIIDILDLVSLNSSMQGTVSKYITIPVTNKTEIEDKVLQEDFFENLYIEASSEEFDIFDNYDYTISISSKETEIIKSKTSKTHVVYIPVKQPICQLGNQYSGDAILTIGPNMFNIQGYLYFIKKVLPLILERDSTFSLQVTGGHCKNIYATEGVNLSGFVPDLKALYKTSRFAICPILGGTGQQIKIVEAMAHGLPVIATQFSGERSPIIHNENGFIANNSREFAEYSLQLWQDQNLCKKLGENARNSISQGFSRESLLKDLSLLLN